MSIQIANKSKYEYREGRSTYNKNYYNSLVHKGCTIIRRSRRVSVRDRKIQKYTESKTQVRKVTIHRVKSRVNHTHKKKLGCQNSVPISPWHWHRHRHRRTMSIVAGKHACDYNKA